MNQLSSIHIVTVNVYHYQKNRFHQFKNDFLDEFNKFKTKFLHEVKSFKDNIPNPTPKNTGNQEHIYNHIITR